MLGPVVDTNTGETFFFGNHITTHKEIKNKLFQACIVSAPLGLVFTAAGIVSAPVGLFISIAGICKIFIRAIGILRGDFIDSARKNIHEKWLLRRLEWVNAPSTQKPTLSSYYRMLVLRAVLIELPKNVIKMVTTPLQMVAQTCIALFGICMPYQRSALDAVWMITKVQVLWSRDLRLRDSNSVFPFFFSISEFFLCMQSKQTYAHFNLYAVTQYNYCSSSCRSSLLKIHTILKERRMFWNRFLTEEKVNKMIDATELLRNSIGDVMKDDANKCFCKLTSEEEMKKIAEQKEDLAKGLEDGRKKLQEGSFATPDAKEEFSQDLFHLEKLQNDWDSKEKETEKKFSVVNNITFLLRGLEFVENRYAGFMTDILSEETRRMDTVMKQVDGCFVKLHRLCKRDTDRPPEIAPRA